MHQRVKVLAVELSFKAETLSYLSGIPIVQNRLRNLSGAQEMFGE